MSSTSTKESHISHINMISFIGQSVNDLTINERKEIYKIMGNSSMDESKVQEKGDGILIKFKDIPRPVIQEIYNYIVRKLGEKQEQLDNCTVENDETE